MPEIPDVLVGELIEPDDWGNPIRDRTVQRYASVAERDTESPTPGPGDLSWLADDDQIYVYDGAAWLRVVVADDGADNVSIGTDAKTTATSLFVRRDASGTASAARLVITTGSPQVGGLIISLTRGAVVTQVILGNSSFRVDDAELLSFRSGTLGTHLRMESDGASDQWRFRITGAGQLQLQSSPDGTAWTTVESWNAL